MMVAGWLPAFVVRYRSDDLVGRQARQRLHVATRVAIGAVAIGAGGRQIARQVVVGRRTLCPGSGRGQRGAPNKRHPEGHANSEGLEHRSLRGWKGVRLAAHLRHHICAITCTPSDSASNIAACEYMVVQGVLVTALTRACSALGAVFVLVSTSLAQTPKVEPVQVKPGIWMVQGEAALGSSANRNFISNAAFVVTPDGWWWWWTRLGSPRPGA